MRLREHPGFRNSSFAVVTLWRSVGFLMPFILRKATEFDAPPIQSWIAPQASCDCHKVAIATLRLLFPLLSSRCWPMERRLGVGVATRILVPQHICLEHGFGRPAACPAAFLCCLVFGLFHAFAGLLLLPTPASLHDFAFCLLVLCCTSAESHGIVSKMSRIRVFVLN